MYVTYPPFPHLLNPQRISEQNRRDVRGHFVDDFNAPLERRWAEYSKRPADDTAEVDRNVLERHKTGVDLRKILQNEIGAASGRASFCYRASVTHEDATDEGLQERCTLANRFTVLTL